MRTVFYRYNRRYHILCLTHKGTRSPLLSMHVILYNKGGNESIRAIRVESKSESRVFVLLRADKKSSAPKYRAGDESASAIRLKYDREHREHSLSLLSRIYLLLRPENLVTARDSSLCRI